MNETAHVTETKNEAARMTDRRRLRFAIIMSVIALTVPAAYFHGLSLHRWGDHDDLKARTETLSDIPLQLGQWLYVADGKPIRKGLLEQLELRGYSHRIYEHQATGQRIAMLLLVGPSGPLVRHPPEICYQTRANRLLESRPLDIQTGDQTAHLRLLSYESSSSIDGDFFVAYAFGSGANWDNPGSPRLAYAGQPVLYKLHALTDVANEVSPESPDGLVDFLTQLLPALSGTTSKNDMNRDNIAAPVDRQAAVGR